MKVGCDPPNAAQQLRLHKTNTFFFKERSPRSGLQYRIEHNHLPWNSTRLPNQKGSDFAHDSRASQHPDFDSGKVDVVCQAIQGLPHQGWSQRFDGPYSLGRLYRQG
jgi:hypothetical protein